jgi:hypothetical protein
VVTARNLYVTIASNPKLSGLPVWGAWAMIVVAGLLLLASLVIGWDGFKAYQRWGRSEPVAPPGVPGRAVAS